MSLVDNQEIRAIYEQLLAARRKRGLPDQELTEANCKIAQDWADYMARTGDFRHGGGEEMVARSTDPIADETDCIEIWLSSTTGHREQTLGNDRQVGFGIARSSRGTYWAADYPDFSLPPVPIVPPKPTRPRWLEWLFKLLGIS